MAVGDGGAEPVDGQRGGTAGVLLYARGNAAPSSAPFQPLAVGDREHPAQASAPDLAEARRRLERSASRAEALPLLGASALLAASALSLAGAVILGPVWARPQTPPAAAASIGP